MDRAEPRTLLEGLVQGSDHTIEEHCAAFERCAREAGERATLSVRQLNRWMAGSVTSARPASRRVAERLWGYSFAQLIGSPEFEETPSQVRDLESVACAMLPGNVSSLATFDEAYVDEVYGTIWSIVRLDNRYGSADLVRIAARLFQSVQRDSANIPHTVGDRDVNALLGEVAELVGWLAYDANQHDLVRRMNNESLYYSRLAGDESTELLTLQNASMHAGAMGRPYEALQIARSILEGDRRLSPRLRSLFLTRKARAMAQAGDESAVAMFGEIRSLYLEGTDDTDPAWAWWIDDRELAWHKAMTLRDLGKHHDALDYFTQSVDATPDSETRSQFLHRAYLLQARLDAGSFHVEELSATLASLAREVGSPRTVSIVRSAVRSAGHRNLSDSDAESVRQLSSVIDTQT